MSNILFVSEGKKPEGSIVNKINQLFFKNDKVQLIHYGFNIYDLYDEVKNDDFIEIEKLLLEKAVDQDCKKILEENKFSEIYLIFDFDPHDHRFDQEKVQKMVELFCDETDLGKLYINYPMIESIRHYTENIDYNNLKIDTNELPNYKKISDVNPLYTEVRNWDIKIYKKIFQANIDKILFFNGISDINYEIYSEVTSQTSIFNHEIEFHKRSKVSVLNTFVLFPADYYGYKSLRYLVK